MGGLELEVEEGAMAAGEHDGDREDEKQQADDAFPGDEGAEDGLRVRHDERDEAGDEDLNNVEVAQHAGLQKGGRGDEGSGPKHGAEVAPCDVEVLRPEEDPGKKHDGEGEGDLEGAGDAFEPASAGGEAFPGKHEPVHRSPDDKGPLSTMPEAADDHDGHQVGVGAGGAEAVASERDVEVIAKKRGKGDVPAAPEFGDAGRFVGGVEVLDEVEAEEFGEPDGHVRVGREVEIDLEGVGEDSGPSGKGRQIARTCTEGSIGDEAHGVGNEDLFGESKTETGEAERELAEGVLAVAHLMGDDAIPDDGAGDEVREKRDETGEIEERLCGFGVAAIKVDAVAEALENVEGDACWKNDVLEKGRDRDLAAAEPRGDRLGGLNGEGGVFEEGEGAQVRDDGEHDSEFAPGLIVPGIDDHAAEVVVEQGSAEHEQHKPRIPPPVENHAGTSEKEVPESDAGA